MDTKQPEEPQSLTLPEDLHQLSPNARTKRVRAFPVTQRPEESSSSTRKRVQFADMLGLELADVRHFGVSEDARLKERWRFSKPVTFTQFSARLRRLGVALESVTSASFGVKGAIRVVQRHGRREVGLRYTFNNWRTFSDLHAAPSSDEEEMDGEQFHFLLQTPLCLCEDSTLEFAVYCWTDQGEFWDNNDGQNYILSYQDT